MITKVFHFPRLLFCLAVTIAIGAMASLTASGAIVINVGNHFIDAAPGQQIDLFVVSTDPGNDPLVTGFNLRAQIGDGFGPNPEPVFSSVSFDGTIWGTFPATVTGGPIAGLEQFAQSSVVFNASGQSVAANGQLVRLTIDASGFETGGLFAFSLASSQIGVDSDFVLAGGATHDPVIINGSITVTAVPEPATLALLIGGTVVTVVRRRFEFPTRCERPDSSA